MKTMIVTFESGKQRTYHGTDFQLLLMKTRVLDNEERRNRLHMEVDKVVNFKITDCIY